jgi:demethylphylloquinone reductase
MRLAHRALLNLASALARSPLRARAPVAAQMGLSRETLALDAPDIAILGGGFGGLYTALRLSSLDWGDRPRPHVTLIDRSDRFVFLPMLYELATGATAAWEVAPLFEDILAGSGITFVQGEVRALDKAARLVEVAGVRSPGAGSEPTIQRVAYDACVVALGSEPSPASLPGAERALPFYSFKDATVLRQRLQTKRADTTTPLRIAIVGGGYIGVELAANLARWGKSVRGSSSPSVDLTLIHRADCIMSNSAEFSRQVGPGGI